MAAINLPNKERSKETRTKAVDLDSKEEGYHQLPLTSNQMLTANLTSLD